MTIYGREMEIEQILTTIFDIVGKLLYFILHN